MRKLMTISEAKRGTQTWCQRWWGETTEEWCRENETSVQWKDTLWSNKDEDTI